MEQTHALTGTGSRMREWYVTASHRILRPHTNDVRELPYGTGHLRKVGAPFTACGEPALLWPTFWDLPAETLENLCSECRRTVALSTQSNSRPGSHDD